MLNLVINKKEHKLNININRDTDVRIELWGKPKEYSFLNGLLHIHTNTYAELRVSGVINDTVHNTSCSDKIKGLEIEHFDNDENNLMSMMSFKINDMDKKIKWLKVSVCSHNGYFYNLSNLFIKIVIDDEVVDIINIKNLIGVSRYNYEVDVFVLEPVKNKENNKEKQYQIRVMQTKRDLGKKLFISYGQE